jgi:hypothetical protein
MFQVWVYDSLTDASAGVVMLPGIPREGDEVHVAGEACRVRHSKVVWGAYPADTSVEIRVHPVSNTCVAEWWK